MKMKFVILSFGFFFSLSSYAASFNANGDGTVTDFSTGLVWQQLDGHNNSSVAWINALFYCSNLVLGGNSNWRLPQVKELASIVDRRRDNPSIDLALFPDALPRGYWTNTNNAMDTTQAWVVEFGNSQVNRYGKTFDGLYIRCVR